MHSIDKVRNPHSAMKNNRNIVECCNNTYQGAPDTGKELQCWPVQCHTIYTKYAPDMETINGNQQMMRKLKEFAKMCCTCNTSPKLALRTSVTTSHVTCLLLTCFHPFGQNSISQYKKSPGIFASCTKMSESQ